MWKIRHFVCVEKNKEEGKHMTYKTGDQVQDEANVPIHKLIFQKIKKTCESGRPGWIILDEDKNEFTSCFTEEFDLIKKYLDFANSHMPLSREQSHSVSIEIRHSKMITLTFYENYLAIKTYKDIDSVHLFLSLSKDEYTIKCYGSKDITILIYPDGAVMTARPNFDRKYYPTTVKNVIQRLPSDVQKALFEEFAGNSLLYKDFMTDKFLATMRLTDLDKKFNKLDYFQSAFPDIAFPKTANKMNCYELYAIGCAEKYIEPEQTGLLFEKDYRIDKVQDFTPSKRRCKEIGKNYIKSILKQKVTEEVLYEFDFFIDDYVEMAMELKEKIDIKAGKKKIRKLHDEYAERLLKKKHRGKIKIQETPLKYLKLPKEFILLDAPGALCQEQKRQHNCVSSYIGRIEKGSCIIYSADINGEHVTIEIRYRKTRGKYTFIVPQCLKMWNECCSEETLKYVKEQVKEAGEQAVKKYERKIERKAKNQ